MSDALQKCYGVSRGPDVSFLNDSKIRGSN